MNLNNSANVLTGDCALTTNTYGVKCVSEIGAKSFTVSYGKSDIKNGLIAMLAAACSSV